MRVDDRRTDEAEPPLFEIFADRIGKVGSRRDFAERFESVLNRSPIDEPPDVGIERPELFLHLKESLGVLNCRSHLGAISNYAWILKQPWDIIFVVCSHLVRIEAVECLAVAL